MDIKELMIEYKVATENFILEIKNNGDGQIYINKREDIINVLKEKDIDKEYFKEVCKELNIISLEKKAMDVLNDEKINIKNEIEAIKSRKRATMCYEVAMKNINFLNKKI